MPRWAKNATVFITENVKAGTSFSYVPKPILEMFDNPRRLTFRVTRGGTVTVEAAE